VSRGREDSARAPRIKRRTDGGARRAFFQESPPPDRGGWRECRSAGSMLAEKAAMELVERTPKALETFRCHTPTGSDVVWTELVYDAGDSHGIGQQLCSLAHLSVLI